jgi:predicted GIY-YIG superfamily endonuclease
MVKQVRVNTATGSVTGRREHPAPVHQPAVWYEEQRDAVPAFDPDTQIAEQDNKLVGDKYVYGYTVRSLTAQELADEATEAVKQEIALLETVPRRIRESLIATGSADQGLIDEEASILIKRTKL